MCSTHFVVVCYFWQIMCLWTLFFFKWNINQWVLLEFTTKVKIPFHYSWLKNFEKQRMKARKETNEQTNKQTNKEEKKAKLFSPHTSYKLTSMFCSTVFHTQIRSVDRIEGLCKLSVCCFRSSTFHPLFQHRITLPTDSCCQLNLI